MVPTPAPASASIGPWIGRGVDLLRARLGPWLLLSLLSLLPGAVSSTVVSGVYLAILSTIGPRVVEGPDASLDVDALQAQLAVAGPVILAALVLGTLGTVYLMVGMYRAALRQADGGTPRLADLGAGGGTLARALGAATLASALTFAGLILCVVPGLLVAGRLQFAVLLALDRELSPGEAVRQSWRATSGDALGFTLHALAVGTLSSLGSFLCGVGMVLTWPLFFTATAAGYRELFPSAGPGSAGAGSPLQASHAGW